MDTLILLLGTAFFAIIGIVGFGNPNKIIRSFGSTPHPDIRNEIRTVYGGMCVGLALAGIAALAGAVAVQWTASVFALILLSNAIGRGIGLVIERSSKVIVGYLVLEALLGIGAMYVVIG